MTADAMTIRDGVRLVLTNDLEFSSLWHKKVPRQMQSSLGVSALLQVSRIDVRSAFGRVLVTTADEADRQILNKTLVLYEQGSAHRSEQQRAAHGRKKERDSKNRERERERE
jgi:hypothetical protein